MAFPFTRILPALQNILSSKAMTDDEKKQKKRGKNHKKKTTLHWYFNYLLQTEIQVIKMACILYGAYTI